MQTRKVERVAADGWRLRATVVEPDLPARALIVAGHAMMVDARTLWRPGRPSLVGTLAAAGFRVLVADLRGHGESGPRADEGGNWSYDALVADTALWLEWGRELAGGLPLLWLSHSLFGHTSLAFFGQSPHLQPRAFAALAVNAWNRQFEPSRAQWLAKSLIMRSSRWVAERAGKLPARQLRMGNNDEALDYWRDLTRMAATHWQARDGTDYLAGLANVKAPILCVFSDGDRLFTRPADGMRFTSHLPGRTALVLGPRVGVPALRGIVPGHMGLVTDPRAEPLWQHVADWFGAQCGDGSGASR